MNPSRKNLQTPGTPEKWEVTAHKIMMRMPHFCIALMVLMLIVKLFNFFTP
jgi:hypothetical protein